MRSIVAEYYRQHLNTTEDGITPIHVMIYSMPFNFMDIHYGLIGIANNAKMMCETNERLKSRG
jgi:hypothetical protein